MVKCPYWLISGKLAGSCIPLDKEAVRRWRELGIGAVVVLVEEWEFSFYGWSLREYLEALEELGMDYLLAPTEDGYAPDEETMYTIVKWIHEKMNEGKAVLVHCHGGIGRTPTVLAAYLMYARGIDEEEALREVYRVNEDMSITNEQYMALIAFRLFLRGRITFVRP